MGLNLGSAVSDGATCSYLLATVVVIDKGSAHLFLLIAVVLLLATCEIIFLFACTHYYCVRVFIKKKKKRAHFHCVLVEIRFQSAVNSESLLLTGVPLPTGSAECV